AQPEVQSQPARDFPVVLEETTVVREARPVPVRRDVDVETTYRGRGSKEEICERAPLEAVERGAELARVVAVERPASATRSREGVVHADPLDLEAGLEGVGADDQAQAVGDVELGVRQVEDVGVGAEPGKPREAEGGHA